MFAEEPEAIVGGQSAVLGEFPHQISLRYYNSHICGGSIIGPTKILTAAHCVEGMSPRNLKVATGTVQINGGEIHSIAKIVMHPEYSDRVEDSWKNDIAVITVSRSKYRRIHTTAICLYNFESTSYNFFPISLALSFCPFRLNRLVLVICFIRFSSRRRLNMTNTSLRSLWPPLGLSPGRNVLYQAGVNSVRTDGSRKLFKRWIRSWSRRKNARKDTTICL